MASTITTAARRHVEEIRRRKFSIGGEPNPLTEDLHQAVKNLSAELYAKDVHFLMELIQNAEDNEYPEGVDPSLEFVITSKDITKTGAPATLLVFNNEKGFSDKNIESICSVGRSTKKGLRTRGYIGEKGIGFKSVFLITAQPYIFSNGYQIRFNEKPCEHCNVGYIVPEWVEEDPTVAAIKSVYGSASALPTTTLVLPLKPDKVEAVKGQISSVHPEVLLFLSKIRRLSVREDNVDPTLNSVTAISISSEKNFATSKSMNADSYTLHLNADIGDEADKECGYYMWKQRFPVKQENKVDARTEVEDWVITLAFPHGARLKRGLCTLPGIYSFLPTETVTNFPFIIQADFLLASSRESILWDNKWNQGILDCVPVAFVNAFTSLVKSIENAPVSSLPNMFRFIPINDSSHPKLNLVRDAIKAKLMNEPIVPCESFTGQKVFRKPVEVGRLKPAFWSILNRARDQGVVLSNISSHGAYLLSSAFDKSEYNVILAYLEIQPVDNEWYARCIANSNIVMGVAEDVYVQLLVFIAEGWGSLFYKTNIKNTPLIKFVRRDGNVDLGTAVSGTNKLMATNSVHISWLINWNTEFCSSTGHIFLPHVTQEAINSCSKKPMLVKWLKEEAKVKFVSVFEYADLVSCSLYNDCKLAVTYAHFLYNSLKTNYLWTHEVQSLCSRMPLVDNYRQITVKRSGVLVPANGSKWVQLFGSNPWRQHSYVELGEDYTRDSSYFGNVISGEDLVSFLGTYVGAADVPRLCPPNTSFPTLSAPLTKEKTFLLLNWLRNLKSLRVNIPERFLSCIKNGSWLKISLSGSSGCRPPSESFMLDSSLGNILRNGSVLVDIPLLDEVFYGDEMRKYKEELQTIGVRCQDTEACQFIGKRFMSLPNLTRDHVLSILKFLEYLGANYISNGEFIRSIKGERWLRTSRGYMTPSNCVLFSQEWDAASQISDIPFLDHDYYGKEVLSFKKELALLGVVVTFDGSYQLVLDNLNSSSLLTGLSSEAIFLVLRCIQHLPSSDKLVHALKNTKCLKTNLGYRYPSECFLLDPESKWGCLLQVFGSFGVLDQQFYGFEIKNYLNELRKIGVRFEDTEACQFIGKRLMSLAVSSKLTRDNVYLILKFIRNLGAHYIYHREFIESIRGGRWLRTTQGDMTPSNSVLFSQEEWNIPSQVSDIPFIDQDYYGQELHSFQEELDLLGVVVKFNNNYQLVVDNLKSSPLLTGLSSDAMFLILKCIQYLPSSDKVVQEIKTTKCLKTNLGYKCPPECSLLNAEAKWGCLLQVFGSFPFLDQEFYGSSIFYMANELKKLGVMVNLGDATKEFTRAFKQHALLSMRKEHVFSFLDSYGKLKKMMVNIPFELTNCICHEKWLRTRLGDYRSPNECILFGKDWEPISQVSLLPFIDENFYGNGIHDYRAELKGFGVVTDFKDGAKFVADGLFLPQDSSTLTPANVYALLDSVKKLKERAAIPPSFLDKLSQRNWLKTHFGYQRPNGCLLFSSAWDPFLKCNDGPFIDEAFYGSLVGCYKAELNLLGVITDINKGCRLVASYLNHHSNFKTFGRIYNYLSTFNMEPFDEGNKRIWIPRGTNSGEWIMPQYCVLYDKNNIFGEQLNVLENCKYEKKILEFFAKTFNVKVHPSVDDYCKLWKTWESSGRQITHKECCAFWEFVVRNWNPRTQDTFNKNLSKLPVLDHTSNRIFLSDKCDVLIGDDLFLTDLFKNCSRPIFVWYPQPSLKDVTRTKILDIYRKLGVRTLSESAQKNVSDVDHAGFEPVNPKEKIIKKGLCKLVLSFLADPNLKLEPDKRHEAVSRVLAIEPFESTQEKMMVRYSLSFSSGEVVEVKPRRMVRWDKQQSKLYIQKIERSSDRKKVMEYAFHFAEEIAEGVLWEKEEFVGDLAELIRLGFLVEFDEEAIEFLMKMKNLQMFVEDQVYLSSKFPSWWSLLKKHLSI